MSNNLKYYAVFTKFENSVEVTFPDIEDCYAYGFDLADAYRMAFDELSNHLPKLNPGYPEEPSSYDEIKKRYPAENQIILPFLVNLRGVPFIDQ